MKTTLSVFALLLGTAIGQAAPVSNPVAAPVVTEPLAEKEGLKISLSSMPYLESGRPHIDVVFQNTSAHRLYLIDEHNSWGINNLSLEITSIDGKVLDQPLMVARTGRETFFENFLSSQTLEPGECTVREVELLTPRDDENAGQSMWLYRNFPWKHLNDRQRVTMRAVYSNAEPYSQSPATDANKHAWVGNITSAPKEYNYY